jgi:hypothetical protein
MSLSRDGSTALFWSAVAQRSDDTAFVFAWTWLICIAGVLQEGSQTLPPKAVSLPLLPLLCHRTP